MRKDSIYTERENFNSYRNNDSALVSIRQAIRDSGVQVEVQKEALPRVAIDVGI